MRTYTIAIQHKHFSLTKDTSDLFFELQELADDGKIKSLFHISLMPLVDKIKLDECNVMLEGVVLTDKELKARLEGHSIPTHFYDAYKQVWRSGDFSDVVKKYKHLGVQKGNLKRSMAKSMENNYGSKGICCVNDDFIRGKFDKVAKQMDKWMRDHDASNVDKFVIVTPEGVFVDTTMVDWSKANGVRLDSVLRTYNRTKYAPEKTKLLFVELHCGDLNLKRLGKIEELMVLREQDRVLFKEDKDAWYRKNFSKSYEMFMKLKKKTKDARFESYYLSQQYDIMEAMGEFDNLPDTWIDNNL